MRDEMLLLYSWLACPDSFDGKSVAPMHVTPCPYT